MISASRNVFHTITRALPGIVFLNYPGIAPASADTTLDLNSENRFAVAVGTYNLSNMSTEIRINPTGGSLGTNLGLEQTLKMPEATQVARLDGYYRINRKQRIEFSFYEIRRAGLVNLPNAVIVGDVTIPAGQTSSSNETRVLKGVWSRSFIQESSYDFGIGAGLHISQTRNTVTDVSAPLTSATNSITLPLPVISFRGKWNITQKLSLEGRQEAFLLDVGDHRGNIVDFALRLEHQTFRNIGFGLGFSYSTFNVYSNTGGLSTEINKRHRGLALYVKGVF